MITNVYISGGNSDILLARNVGYDIRIKYNWFGLEIYCHNKGTVLSHIAKKTKHMLIKEDLTCVCV